MIRNYLKTAYRSLLKNKGFTAINVLGLALGLATCLLIVFYVYDELSYDKYNTKIDRIYRLNNAIRFGGVADNYAITPAPTAAALKSDFPEVEQVVRFRSRGGNQVKKGNQNIQENMMLYADPSVFSVFTLPMIDGDPATALKDPHTVVITETMAKKYFNKTNVVGQTLVFNDTSLFKVTGVIKDIPEQSHFRPDFLISMSSLPEARDNMWFSNNFNTYVLLRPGADYKAFEAKMPAFLRSHAAAQLQSIIHISYDKFEQSGNYFRFSLIPLQDIHLRSNSVGELGMNGNIQYVYIFSIIAVFILLIACVNFMNLSTARSANRAREVGVRKVLGSAKKHLVFQFLTESVIVTLVAAILAMAAAWALLGRFNELSGKTLIITPHMLAWLAPVMLLMVIVIGFIAGSYPAFYLSGFNPISVLKGKISAGFKSGFFRSFLVVFQFCISIFLIIGTLVVYNQLSYIRNKDLGYDRDHVVIIRNTWTLGVKAQAFKQEIKQLLGVKDATLTEALPNENYGNSSSIFKDPVIDQKRAVLSQIWNVDEDYVPTLGMKMVAGRNFSSQMPTDSTAIIINQAAARLLDFKNPVNQLVYQPQDNMVTKLKAYHIIGVVKDFNFNSLRDNVTPVMLFLNQNNGDLSVRINSANIPAMLDQIKAKWASFSPNAQLSYSFMDEDFDAIYRAEQRIGTIAIIFSGLAIIIACLGLFGLAAYAAEQRTKEIGIRKVLGANVSGIVAMLSKDFIVLVLIAIVITSPFAWWAMNKWLLGFAYRINIQWWILALAGFTAILIAFVTISFQSIKAALMNPVKSLRSE